MAVAGARVDGGFPLTQYVKDFESKLHTKTQQITRDDETHIYYQYTSTAVDRVRKNPESQRLLADGKKAWVDAEERKAIAGAASAALAEGSKYRISTLSVPGRTPQVIAYSAEMGPFRSSKAIQDVASEIFSGKPLPPGIGVRQDSEEFTLDAGQKIGDREVSKSRAAERVTWTFVDTP